MDVCFFFSSSFQTHPLLVWMTVTVSRDTVILEEMVGLPHRAASDWYALTLQL